jgi:hypothetical protein
MKEGYPDQIFLRTERTWLAADLYIFHEAQNLKNIYVRKVIRICAM